MMETNLLDRMLSSYLVEHTPVTITLQNKIRIHGKIKAFDSYVIILEGQKREIVYRHAMSCLAPGSEEYKKPASTKPATVKSSPRPSKPAAQQSLRQPVLSASTSEGSINNSMKEGLLKWMKEQKAAK